MKRSHYATSPGGEMLNAVPAKLQAGHLARKEGVRRTERDIVARLARRPMTVNQLASALLLGRSSIEVALRKLEAAGRARRSHNARGGHHATPPLWSLVVEGATDGPHE